MVNLFIKGSLIDQYEDESVEIVSSVLDVQDITKNTGDYSKSFTIPTSKRNNKLLKHWYNATIDGGFDARIRVSGSIDIDGVPFKTGKWLLRGVKMKNGVADSYDINFFGETSSLKEILGKDVLRDLDLSAFDHSYTPAEVQLGLETGLFSNSVIYTPMSQTGMFYDASGGDRLVDGEIQMRNIAKSGTGTGLQYNELRPSLKVIELINAIETKYPLTFTRDFFSTTEFDELYMWLSPDLEGSALGNRTDRIDWGSTDGTWINTTTDVATYTSPTSTRTDSVEVLFELFPDTGFENIQYTIAVKDVDTGVVLSQGVFTGDSAITAIIPFFEAPLTFTSPYTPRNIEFVVASTEAIDYISKLRSTLIIGSTGSYSTVESSQTSGVVSNSAGIVINRLLPDMEVSEFIKGLIQMFKLVVIGREGGDFYVNSLDAYYRTGVRYDITNYVDFSKFDVERGEILSELDFKFAEPQSLLAKQFLDNNGVGYGDSKVKLKDINGDAFDGDVLSVELPFEQIVYERLSDATSGALSSVQVGNVIDIALKPVFTKPHLHYASLIRVSDFESELKYQGNTILNDDVWMPMAHSGVYSPAYSLLFESEVSTYTTETLTNTLYSNHYQDYVQAIFNVKRRTLSHTAKLPIQIITQLELNDIITIKGLDYRINSYKYNLLTGLTKLELINGFQVYSDPPVIPDSCFVADNRGGQYRFNIPNIENFTVTSSVVGNGGASFVTDSVTRNQFVLDVDIWANIPVGSQSRTTNYSFTSGGGGGDEELIIDGDFSNASNWDTSSAGWSIANNKATMDIARALKPAIPVLPLIGQDYNISFRVSNFVAGSVQMSFGGGSFSATSNGLKTFTHTALNSTSPVQFLGSFDNIGVSLTDVSILKLNTGYEQGDIVVNGDFSNSSGWYGSQSNNSAWVVGGGFAQSIGTPGIVLEQASAFDSVIGGCDYTVTYTISDYVQGTVGFWFGSSNLVTTSRSANGTYTETVTPAVDSSKIGLVPTNLPNNINGIFIGKISNLTVVGCKDVRKDEGGMCITQINKVI